MSLVIRAQDWQDRALVAKSPLVRYLHYGSLKKSASSFAVTTGCSSGKKWELFSIFDDARVLCLWRKRGL